jgi:hypothetical protein
MAKVLSVRGTGHLIINVVVLRQKGNLRGSPMKIFRTIFFALMVFFAGGMCFLNLAVLTPGSGVGYEHSWTNVWIYIGMGIAFTLIPYWQNRDTRMTYEEYRKAGF